jgi:hypothetical protein
MSQSLSWWRDLLVADIWQGNLTERAEIEEAVDRLISEAQSPFNISQSLLADAQPWLKAGRVQVTQ